MRACREMLREEKRDGREQKQDEADNASFEPPFQVRNIVAQRQMALRANEFMAVNLGVRRGGSGQRGGRLFFGVGGQVVRVLHDLQGKPRRHSRPPFASIAVLSAEPLDDPK